VPEIYDEVERSAKVRVRYLGYDGKPVEEEAEGVYAVCIQHEIDHLNGVLFIDHLSRLKRDRAVAKVKKDKKTAREEAL
jgi:peptide deformylase